MRIKDQAPYIISEIENVEVEAEAEKIDFVRNTENTRKETRSKRAQWSTELIIRDHQVVSY